MAADLGERLVAVSVADLVGYWAVDSVAATVADLAAVTAVVSAADLDRMSHQAPMVS